LRNPGSVNLSYSNAQNTPTSWRKINAQPEINK